MNNTEGDKEMKFTKTNALKVLEAEIANKSAIYRDLKSRGEEELAKRYLHEIQGLESAKWLLTDKKYFEDMASIYEVA